MTVTPNPYVSLLFSDLNPEALKQVDQRSLGTPTQQIEAALMTYRTLVINRAKHDLLKQREVTGASLMRAVDFAGELYLGRFNTLLGPAAVQAYVRAYRNAGAGDIPMSTLHALAAQHSERMGTYFHQTSKEALSQGFNQYVNRKVISKAAADRVLDAYGLTPRQMNSYVALATPQKVTSAQALPVKAKAREYISRALGQRFKIFAKQEEHNLEQQAQQTAWSWLQDKGKITSEAQKVWLTARDERTCPQCAPMHGKKVMVTERFELPSGVELYVPGVHPNCRCEARLIDPGRMKIEYFDVQKDLYGVDLAEFNEEHPRGQGGRFTAKQRARATTPRYAEVAEREPSRPVIEPAVIEEEKPLRLVEPTALRLTEPTLRLAPTGLTLGEPLHLEEPTKLVLQDPQSTVNLTEPQTKLRLGEVTETDTGVRLEELDSAWKPPTLKDHKQATRMVMRPYEKIEPLRETVYAVQSITSGSNYYQLNQQFFQPDFERAKRTADRIRTGLIYDEWSLKTNDGSDDATYQTKSYALGGRRVKARFTPTELNQIFESVANYDKGDPETPINVRYYDANDDDYEELLYHEPRTPRQIALEWGITPETFEVRILELDSVHEDNDDLGNRVQEGDDAIRVSGAYQTAHILPEKIDYGQGISRKVKVHQLEPFDPAVGYYPDRERPGDARDPNIRRPNDFQNE